MEEKTYINKVLELFTEDSAYLGEEYFDVFDPDGPPVGSYHIGLAGDPSVGIPDCTITPHFETEEELEKWCGENINKLKELSTLDMFPEQFWWEENDFEFN